MRTAAKCLAFVVLLLLPAPLFAQASLTGTVRDASGGVLPGVTVEAASSALIEKTRSAVTELAAGFDPNSRAWQSRTPLQHARNRKHRRVEAQAKCRGVFAAGGFAEYGNCAHLAW